MGGLDHALLEWINHWPEWLAPTMQFFSEATRHGWVRVVLIALLAGMLLSGSKNRKAALHTLVAFPIANEMTDVFKGTFPTPRPCQVADVITRVGCSDNPGTASAHSANMAAVAFIVVYYLRGWGAVWVLIALFTGLSRVYNGVHYPWQVLLGWLCGAFAGLLVTKTWEAFVRLRERVREGKEPDAQGQV